MVEVEDLLKIILVLVVVWIALEIIESVVDVLGWVFDLFRPFIGLIIIALIVLWLLDRI